MNQETESFLMKIKFPITIGYGMTECAPLISFHTRQRIQGGLLRPLPERSARRPDRLPRPGTRGRRNRRARRACDERLLQERKRYGEGTRTRRLAPHGRHGHDGSGRDALHPRTLEDDDPLRKRANIYPEEIEDKLNNMYLVLESLILDSGNGKLKAMVVPDYEQAEAEGVDKNDLPQIMQNNLTELNSLLAAYERVSEIIIYPTEFEKTPKRSIKRYLYSPSLLNK